MHGQKFYSVEMLLSELLTEFVSEPFFLEKEVIVFKLILWIWIQRIKTCNMEKERGEGCEIMGSGVVKAVPIWEVSVTNGIVSPTS